MRKLTEKQINGLKELGLDACRPLKEYSWFVDAIRNNQKKMNSLEKAIDAALDQMDDNMLIKPFLLKNKAEVKIMCLTEYDEARTLAEERADGYEDGFEKGREEGEIKGKIEGVDNLISQFNFSLQDALKAMNLSESDYNELKKRVSMTVSEFESRFDSAR